MRESPLALIYHVEGASGVSSDNVPHQVAIVLPPTIQHLTVPKVQQATYLQATGVTVHALVDDSFMSKTGIVGDVASGDEFRCKLGTNLATRIYYECTTKKAEDADADAAGERSASSEKELCRSGVPPRRLYDGDESASFELCELVIPISCPCSRMRTASALSCVIPLAS